MFPLAPLESLSCICYVLCSVSLVPAGCPCLSLVSGPRNSCLNVPKASRMPEESGTIAPRQPLPPECVVPGQCARHCSCSSKPGWRDLWVLESAAEASRKGTLSPVIAGFGKECPDSKFTKKPVLPYEMEAGSFCSVTCCPRGSSQCPAQGGTQ